MKYKILLATMFFLLSASVLSAATESEKTAANFLAKKSIINDNSADISKYNIDMTITRREMLKVMMNLSGKSVGTSCSGKFSDLDASDWGCKYAEAALENGYIAANKTFRPGDSVTEIEALKMIMQAKGLTKDENADWRAGYVSKAISEKLIDASFWYDEIAQRGWIFLVGARSYSDTPTLTFETETSTYT
jgi:S-layer homology domain